VTEEVSDVFVFQPHRKAIITLAFSPDGERLATVSKEPKVRVWGGAKYERQLFVCDTLTSPPWSALTFSPDGQAIAYAGGIHGLKVWPLTSGQSPTPQRIHPRSNAPWHAHQCCFSPDGSTLFAGTITGLYRFGTADWQELPAFDETRGRMEKMALSPDGRLLALLFSLYDDAAQRWKATGAVIRLRGAGAGERRGEIQLPIDGSIPTGLALSPDGRHLAVIQGAYLRVFDAGTRAQVAEAKAGKRKHLALAFTRDGSRLVTASGDDTVRLWDTATWGEVGALTWEVGPIGCVAATPDGRRLAAGGGTGKVVVWDVD
jgi:WD40 repeat protein